MATDVRAALADLLAALDREEAHAHRPAPDHDLGRYCAEGQRLREDVRRRRREAEAALREETAA
ncbi:MAG: hypothetical protein ACTHMU_24050 [Thermomicrobiales bacterium]